MIDVEVAERIFGEVEAHAPCGDGLSRTWPFEGATLAECTKKIAHHYRKQIADGMKVWPVEYIGPPYSTDIASAWLVVEKMHERGFDATVRTSGDGVYCEFVHYVRYPTEGGSARIDPREGTAALGICLAALAALSALASPTEEVPEGGEGDA